MINYTELTDYLVEVARRHPNIRYVEFDDDIDIFNDADFQCPALVISPMQTTLDEISVVRYGFQIVYLDKFNQEKDNYGYILETAMQYLIGYLSVIDLDYKLIRPLTIEPILIDGDNMAGCQANIELQDQFNLEKFKSKFYE